ncbi:MAG: hypothetical protein EA395_14600 [Phormidium sp. GEM2.Bin31]|nr:MAG: hypothetical protein EA395_14600 [Phormidium sp. GEM2.Bin31]
MCTRLRGLKKRQRDLNEEINVGEAEISYLGGTQRLLKEREVDARYEELEKIEFEIAKIEESRLEKKVESKLIQLNYSESKKYVTKILQQLRKSGGAAAVLLNKVEEFEGEALTRHVVDSIKSQSSGVFTIEFRIDPNTITSPNDLLRTILAWSTPDLPEQVIEEKQVIEAICGGRLVNGKTILIKIDAWNCIYNPCETLKWFVESFWIPLTRYSQDYCLKNKIFKFRLFALIACQEDIPGILDKPYYTPPEKYSPLDIKCENSLIHLPLSDWTEEEIEDWMYLFPPTRYERDSPAIENLAKRFYRESGGKPREAWQLMLEEYTSRTNDETMEAG